MARPAWLSDWTEARSRDPAPRAAAPEPALPPPPPSKAEGAALAEPVARMRQALALLEGADLAPAPAYAFGTVRRRGNQVGHSLAQARGALRRALELARQE